MCRVSLLKSLQKHRRLTTVTLTCLALTGCTGQKYSLPTFWNKQSAKIAAKSGNTQAEDADKFANPFIVLNDSNSLGEEQLLADAGILVTSGEIAAGSGPDIFSDSQRNAQQEMDEIDAAFTRASSQSRQAATAPHRSLEQFKESVAAVHQGESHLDALKSSLSEINANADMYSAPQQEPIAAAADPFQADSAADFSAPPFGADSAPAYSLTEASPADFGQESTAATEFPWTQEKDSKAAAATETSLEKARNLLARSHALLQQNNLLAAHSVAESAQTLLQKTHSVLSPGEVTPEQVLAEIKARQLQHEQNLQLARASKADSASSSTAVVIDLSREWINTPATAHAVHTPRKNDVQQFAEATVLANRPAALPLITPHPLAAPAGMQEAREIAADIPVAPPAETPTYASRSQAEEQQVVLLGEMPVLDSAPPVMTGGNQPVLEFPTEQAPAFSTSSGSGPQLVLGDLENSDTAVTFSSGPQLLAPGAGSNPVAASEELDEFAADFAQFSQTAPLEMDSSMLLIDELELQSAAPRRSWLTSGNLTLLIGGIAVGTLLLFRWRR